MNAQDTPIICSQPKVSSLHHTRLVEKVRHILNTSPCLNEQQKAPNANALLIPGLDHELN